MELKNHWSNLLLFEADKLLPLLHLSCLSLVFLLMCNNTFSLKPTGVICEGGIFASPLFSPPGGPRLLFCGFPFRWVLHFVVLLIRGVIVYDAAICSRDDSLYECGRTCEALFCLFFTACGFRATNTYWCRRPSQRRISISLVSRRSRSKLPHGYKWHPCSLDWPVDPIARFDQSRPSSSPEDTNDEQQRDALPPSTRSRWRQEDALQPPHLLQGSAGRDTCGHLPEGGLRCGTWNTRGLVGSVFYKTKKQGEQSQIPQTL